MIELVLFAAATLGEVACLKAGASSENSITIVADAASASTLASKGAVATACPAGLDWTREAALDQCAVYRNYSAEAAKSYLDLYGVTPEEICDVGRAAAGLPSKPAWPTKTN